MIRELVVNADDFGFSRDVNAGIIEAHVHGILTATTLMANGAAFDDAVRLAREHPRLDIGVHGVLVQGLSLRRAGEPLPATLAAFVQALALRRVHPYEELRAQVERICNAGLHPTHIDTHKHTHLLPPVLDAVCRVAEEYSVRWVRRPFDLPLTGAAEGGSGRQRLLSRCAAGLQGVFARKLRRHGRRATDWFAGFQLTGRFHAAQLVRLFEQLPQGSTEFMCHPGRCTEELRALPTRLKESREAELAALVDPEVRAALDRLGIRLVCYRDL